MSSLKTRQAALRSGTSITAATAGLFDPNKEYSNCGYGTIVPLNPSEPTHAIVDVAIQSLHSMFQRTGTNGDGTSDGNGLQGIFDQAFFKSEYDSLRDAIKDNQPPALSDEQRLGVGMFQMPSDPAKRRQCQDIVDAVLHKHGYHNALWREVPTDPRHIVPAAREGMPAFRQVLIPQGKVLDPYQFEMDLMVIQKIIQNRIEKEELVGKEPDSFYAHGISHFDIAYKGKLHARELPLFFEDLVNPDFKMYAVTEHGRFSTNTQPENKRAQPFRSFAHNGEINNIDKLAEGWYETFAILKPLIEENIGDRLGQEEWDAIENIDLDGSDSAVLDEMMDVMRMAGFSPAAVEALMFQPVIETRPGEDPRFVETLGKIRNVMPAAEGPVGGIVHGIAPDGNIYFVTASDKLGLRPLASEIVNHPELGRTFISISDRGAAKVDRRAEVEREYNPEGGRRIGVNFTTGEVLNGNQLMEKVAAEVIAKFADKKIATAFDVPAEFAPAYYLQSDEAAFYQTLYRSGVTGESVDGTINKMVLGGKEPVVAMGVTNEGFGTFEGEVNFARAKRQKFAQVTNPPVDPLRESHVVDMSVRVAGHHFDAPVISSKTYQSFVTALGDQAAQIDCTFDPEKGETLDGMLERVKQEAFDAAHEGKQIFLSDKGVLKGRVNGAVVLAADVVTRHLKDEKAVDTSVNVSLANMPDPHTAACLVDSGVKLINGWSNEEIIAHNHKQTLMNTDPDAGKDAPAELPYYGDLTLEQCIANLNKGMNASLAKIMSKQGIQSLEAFRGSRGFHYINIDEGFMNVVGGGISRIGGISLEDFEARLIAKHESASPYGLDPDVESRYAASVGDEIVRQHRITPGQNALMQRALDKGMEDPAAGEKIFNGYTRAVNSHNDKHGFHPRDYMGLADGVEPIDVDEVVDWHILAERMRTMHASHGALNRKAHETTAEGINLVREETDSLRQQGLLDTNNFTGPLSGSGEGGERRDRLNTVKSSAIKQVASGRFGVNAEYLTDPSVKSICIKVAQGAKPGEGGQLPGPKVTAEIADLRGGMKEVELISPPPHHDIYSIEDLEQLIYDLKKINTQATVSVKLVSQPGIGTVASGVVKAGADIVEVMDGNGGTAASPQNSVKFAGGTVEEGVAEVQQALVTNGLRDRAQIHAGGGLRTGRDLVRIMKLGADTFELGTEAMFAEGCIHLKTCNFKCDAGLITDDANFRGSPERTKLWVEYLMKDFQQELAKEGVRDPKEIVGRVDLLKQDHFDNGINLSHVLSTAHLADGKPSQFGEELGFRNAQTEHVGYQSPDQTIIAELDGMNDDAVRQRFSAGREWDPENPDFEFKVDNTYRAIGAELTEYLYHRFGVDELEQGQIQIRAGFEGVPGASFGAFLGHGILLHAPDGTANYTGKGLSGGTIITRYVGDVAAYGATGGNLVVGEQLDNKDSFVGQRFGIRNSGANLIVGSTASEYNKPVGDNAAEYMTKGVAYFADVSGFNASAGHSGGIVLAHDPERKFEKIVNPEAQPKIRSLKTEAEKAFAKSVVETLHRYAPSQKTASMLMEWDNVVDEHVVIDPFGSFAQEAQDWYEEQQGNQMVAVVAVPPRQDRQAIPT